MGMLINPDNTHRQVEPQNGATYSLAELQGFVGGLIQIVNLGNSSVLVVNEEGLILNLSYNHAASLLIQNVLPGQIIVGTALLVKENEIL